MQIAKKQFFSAVIAVMLSLSVHTVLAQNDPLYISSAGNVGIGGVENPTEKLVVKGNISTTGGIKATGLVEAGSITASGTIKTTGSLEVNELKATGRVKDKTGFVMPVGTVIAFAGESLPEGWLSCDGARYRRDDQRYKDLFDAIRYTWGGDGNLQFNVPDLRGYFLRGVSGDTNNDPDKNSRSPKSGGQGSNKVGSYQNDGFAKHNHSNNIWDKLLKTSKCNDKHTFEKGDDIGCETEPDLQNCSPLQDAGGNETRPKNAYVNYMIKY